MRRRDFLTLAGVVATAPAWPLAGLAQQAAKVPRVAVLNIPFSPGQKEAFDQGLGDFGYVPDRNIEIDLFIAPTTADLPAFAEKAVASKPDVIVAIGAAPPLAALMLTNSIPIIFENVFDPIGLGLVSNLAHPGGNVTGTALMSTDVIGKQLELMREIAPALSRIAFLALPVNQSSPQIVAQVQSAAHSLHIEALELDVIEGEDWDTLLKSAASAGDALLIPPFQYFADNYAALADAAVRLALPTVGSGPLGAEAGFLVGYGADAYAILRQSVGYLDRILKGDRPGDLPVEQPTIFDLAINLKTAKALGIAIPTPVLAQATQVIEEDGSVH